MGHPLKLIRTVYITHKHVGPPIFSRGALRLWNLVLLQTTGMRSLGALSVVFTTKLQSIDGDLAMAKIGSQNWTEDQRQQPANVHKSDEPLSPAYLYWNTSLRGMIPSSLARPGPCLGRAGRSTRSMRPWKLKVYPPSVLFALAVCPAHPGFPTIYIRLVFVSIFLGAQRGEA